MKFLFLSRFSHSYTFKKEVVLDVTKYFVMRECESHLGILLVTKHFVMRECENILSGYLCAVTAVFSQQDGIYGFKFLKRFLEISCRDHTLFSLLLN